MCDLGDLAVAAVRLRYKRTLNMHRALKNALAKSALLKGASTLGELELGSTFGARCLSTSTDLKAVLAEKIPAEQVGSY